MISWLGGPLGDPEKPLPGTHLQTLHGQWVGWPFSSGDPEQQCPGTNLQPPDDQWVVGPFLQETQSNPPQVQTFSH
jgi:hypothetical protein